MADRDKAIEILKKCETNKADSVRKAAKALEGTLDDVRELAVEIGCIKVYGNTISVMKHKAAHSGYATIDDDKLDAKHEAIMEQKRKEHAEATSWMEHVKPLYQRKQEYEAEIRVKQEELDRVRQEYRNFLATIKQLTEEKHDT